MELIEKTHNDNINIYCLECQTIPLYQITEENNNIYIEYICPNKHSKKLLFNQFLFYNNNNNNNNNNEFKCNEHTNNKLNNNNNNKINSICQNCQQKISNIIYSKYCMNCKKILCKKCIQIHLKKDHDIIKTKDNNLFCLKHNNSFSLYCNDCQENLCFYCIEEHKEHTLTNFLDLKLTKNSKENIKNNIITLKNHIKQIEDIKKNVLDPLNFFQDKNRILLSFYNKLINEYENEEKNSSLTYNIMSNINNLNNYVNEIIFKNKKELKSLNYVLNSMKNKMKINKFKEIKTLTFSESWINNIIQLNQNYICFGNGKGKIFLLEINLNEFSLCYSFIAHEDSINYIEKISENKIISASEDNTLKIYNLTKEKYDIIQVLNGHTDGVTKVIKLNNENKLISCDRKGDIKIWKFINGEYKNIKTIEAHNDSIWNLIQINKYELASSSLNENNIKFWTLNNFDKNPIIINNIKSCDTVNCLCMLDDYRLCVGCCAHKYLVIIDTKIKQILQKVEIGFYCLAIIKLNNGEILTAERNNDIDLIRKYNISNEKWERNENIEKVHKEYIRGLIQLNNGIILSCGDDNEIHVWE